MYARLLLVAVALAPSGARAAMLRHHDLASLALEATVIVRAERTGGPDEAAQYRVVGVLGGTGLRPRDTITIDQGLYRVDANGTMTGSPMPGSIEPTAVLFLSRSDPPNALWHLVPSGLRLFAGGRAFRFEQFDNPGPYVTVPQHTDPDDVLGVRTSPQLSLAQLEAAIATAVARAARARAAIAAHDVAAIAAILSSRPLTPNDELGLRFYEDRIAVRAFHALIAAHEIDAALDVLARTRGLRPWIANGISDDDLLDRMEEASTPLSRRLAAPNLLAMMPAEDTVRRLFALSNDPATPRELRVAVIDQLGEYAGVSGTDSTWPRRRSALARELTALVRAGTRSETDDEVRVALLEAAGRWQLRAQVPAARAVALSAIATGTQVRFRGARMPSVEVENHGVVLLRSDGSVCEAPALASTTAQLFWRGTLDASRCQDAVRARMQIGPAGRVLVVEIRR